jgi:hypothetical protein
VRTRGGGRGEITLEYVTAGGADVRAAPAGIEAAAGDEVTQ